MSNARSSFASLAPALVLAAALASPSVVRAEGFELTSPGARANGRGGADFVGGDSPISFFYNPAQIARLHGYQADVALHLHFSERCMQRVGVDESTDPPSAGTTYPEVCSEGPPAVLPELAFTLHPIDKLSIGVGVQVPVAAFRQFHLGDPDTGTLDGQPDGEPTPTRYLLVQEKLLQLFLTMGAAYDVVPGRLRVGASFGWGITKLDFTNAAFSRIETTALGGAVAVTARSDALNRLEGVDGFVPRVSVGAWGQPVEDLPLELGLSFQWTGNVKTDGGTLHLHGYNAEADIPIIGTVMPTLDADGTVHDVGLNVPQTSQLAFGARYAHKLDRPADGIGDRLSTERFDVEADLVLTFGKRVDRFHVDIPDDATLDANATVNVAGIEMTLPTTVDLPDAIDLPHRWKTQVGLRVGGDYNIVPGLLGLRAGLSFQGNGVQHGYEQLDFTPFKRVGLHLGATVRIAHLVDVSLAYAHIFQPDVTIAPADARIRRVATVTDENDPNAQPTNEDAALVNAGKITSHYNLLLLQVGAKF